MPVIDSENLGRKLDEVFEAEGFEVVAVGVDARQSQRLGSPSQDHRLSEGSIEGSLHRLHVAEEIGEMDDAGEIGLVELDTAGGSEFEERHGGGSVGRAGVLGRRQSGRGRGPVEQRAGLGEHLAGHRGIAETLSHGPTARLTQAPQRVRVGHSELEVLRGDPVGHRHGLLRAVDQHGVPTLGEGGGDVVLAGRSLGQPGDRLGHGVGDQLLRAIADRIRERSGSGDTPARLGGDEFALLLEDRGGVERAIDVAEHLLDRLREPVRLAGYDLTVLPSVGVAVAAPGMTTSSLLRDADIAMYEAKRAGKGQIKALIVNGGNPALVFSDTNNTLKALDSLELLVVNDLFVSATAMLANTYEPADRFRAQGFNDLAVFGSQAVASLLAGTAIETLGWKTLNLVALPLLIFVLLALHRPQKPSPETT